MVSRFTDLKSLRGVFTNYVDKVLAFFDHLHPGLTCSTLTKSGHLWTTYLPCLVNVVHSTKFNLLKKLFLKSKLEIPQSKMTCQLRKLSQMLSIFRICQPFDTKRFEKILAQDFSDKCSYCLSDCSTMILSSKISRVVQIMYCPLKLKNWWQAQNFLII